MVSKECNDGSTHWDPRAAVVLDVGICDGHLPEIRGHAREPTTVNARVMHIDICCSGNRKANESVVVEIGIVDRKITGRSMPPAPRAGSAQ